MSSYRFTVGQCFVWRKTLYQVKKILVSEQRINIEDLETGALLTIELSTLTHQLFAGTLHFVEERQLREKKKRHRALDLSDYPPKLVEIARWRLQVIRPLLDLPREKRTEDVVSARAKEVQAEVQNMENGATKKVSRTTIFRWMRDYCQSGNDLRCLIPRYDKRGAPQKSRLGSTVDAIVNIVLRENCFRPEKVATDDLVALIAAQIADENQLRPEKEKLQMPSRATIARRVVDLDIQERLAAQRGKRTARREFSQAEKMDYPKLPYERVEIDHTRCDVIVIDEKDNLPLGRPTLTYCLDMATRYPLGFYLGFEPPSYFTVMECLYHTICPKEDVREKYDTEHDWVANGIPSTLVIDNGKEFIGQDLPDACELLGIVLQQCPVMTPELKAGVERHFGTLNSGVFHTLPGTTFSNIFERGEYDSVQQACITLNELERALTIFLVDIYAERWHRGLKGIPARRWDKAMADFFMPCLPPSRDELAILLGRVAWRTVQPYGIEFECLRYNDRELGLLRARMKGEKIKLKYHPGDLGQIYVYNPFEKIYLAVLALDQEYASGLSYWKHRIIRRMARLEADKVDLAALGRARRKIQELVDMARTRKKISTRSKVARWDGQSSRVKQQKQIQSDASLASVLPAEASISVTELEEDTYEYDYDLPTSQSE